MIVHVWSTEPLSGRDLLVAELCLVHNVVPFLRSLSIHFTLSKSDGWLFGYVSGSNQSLTLPPRHMLAGHSSTVGQMSSGLCWPFDGGQGDNVCAQRDNCRDRVMIPSYCFANFNCFLHWGGPVTVFFIHERRYFFANTSIFRACKVFSLWHVARDFSEYQFTVVDWNLLGKTGFVYLSVPWLTSVLGLWMYWRNQRAI